MRSPDCVRCHDKLTGQESEAVFNNIHKNLLTYLPGDKDLPHLLCHEQPPPRPQTLITKVGLPLPSAFHLPPELYSPQGDFWLLIACSCQFSVLILLELPDTADHALLTPPAADHAPSHPLQLTTPSWAPPPADHAPLGTPSHFPFLGHLTSLSLHLCFFPLGPPLPRELSVPELLGLPSAAYSLPGQYDGFKYHLHEDSPQTFLSPTPVPGTLVLHMA